jgi:hypothetical protein
MISSAEEVFEILLKKWKDEQSLIVAVLTGADWVANVMGAVSECSAEAVQLGGPITGLMLSFGSATRFEYEDPREAPEWLRGDTEFKYVCCVGITFSDGRRCALCETTEHLPIQNIEATS